ncbi:MAG: AbrB/MazE/SpoVT family DNA-binding domain-containing protein [Thermoanaerobaculia bacterium]
MRVKIDRAGRVLIPSPLRAAARLEAGTELEVTVDGLAVRLERVVPGPEVVERRGRLVARPRAPADERTAVDVSSLVADERKRWPF